ncbi:PIN domain-containing protein [Streptomyces sp. ODS05-4]|uniref:PIN domain-containing protein n=1 Tax=Streptomyces sp. ODS05-4 TaxID=2944939 RepID=UPI002109523F|nr:PIN domain-containing protein [Streptomyces sp. ODS05-4]
MSRYLLDSSALWRVLRDKDTRDLWQSAAEDGDIRSCHPQRAEFLRSARNLAEYDAMSEMFSQLYEDAAVPKTAGQWIESLQRRLAKAGAHRALSAVDLLVCATAAHHGLVVVHDDNDFVTAARCAVDLQHRPVGSGPF